MRTPKQLYAQQRLIYQLDAEETAKVKLRVQLPRDENASGQFVIAVLDVNDDVPEADEGNNMVTSPPIP